MDVDVALPPFLNVWICLIFIHSLILKPFFSHFFCVSSVTRMHLSLFLKFTQSKSKSILLCLFIVIAFLCWALPIAFSGHYMLLWASTRPSRFWVLLDWLALFIVHSFFFTLFQVLNSLSITWVWSVSHFRVHQNYLEGLLKQWLLGLAFRISDSLILE